VMCDVSPGEPEKGFAIDAEYLSGKRFPYQEDISLVQDVDLIAATPGEDINWLEDVELLAEDGVPAVFDRYSNSFIKIYFEIPTGREDEIARKVLICICSRAIPTGSCSSSATASSPSRAGTVGGGLEDGGHRLCALDAGGVGVTAALSAHGSNLPLAVRFGPPITVTCECGAKRDLRYGERALRRGRATGWHEYARMLWTGATCCSRRSQSPSLRSPPGC
jgi:hypothetical protein